MRPPFAFLDEVRYRRHLESKFKTEEGRDALAFTLRRGVPQQAVNDLILDCLVAYRKHLLARGRWAREFQALPVLRRRGEIRLARKAAKLRNPVLRAAAQQELKTAQWAADLRRTSRFQSDTKEVLDRLLLSLRAIYITLVDQSRTPWCEYLPLCVMRILKVGNVEPVTRRGRRTKWTPTAVLKRLQRAGGDKDAAFTAFVLLSTDPRLKRFRTGPPDFIRDQELERRLEMLGRSIYRGLPHPVTKTSYAQALAQFRSDPDKSLS